MPTTRLYLPDLLYAEGRAHAGLGLLVDGEGRVAGQASAKSITAGVELVRLSGKALIPGLANAHSHTFQRLFRGRAEGRTGAVADTFWTWREQMYRAAGFVSPEDLYDVARATFLEMVTVGVTAVGEFHYLHRDRDGSAYAEPNLLSDTVIAAARSVGLRICLLRTAYFRAGFERAAHEGQRRFYELPEEFLTNLEELAARYAGVAGVSVGAAPHSIRAVPLERMVEIAALARDRRMPLHLHISEQVEENAACVAEYGATPVQLIAANGILSPATTLVHAIHLSEAEFAAVAEAGSTICSCPTTERNLGDGIFPADVAWRLGIPVALGTDSQAQIDLLEDARQLEYHLRLRDQHRAILDGASASAGSVGDELLQVASGNGYRALGLAGGQLAKGDAADFFTVDLNDLSLLGVDAESLASQAVFAMARGAVRDVAVQGELILQDGRHRDEDAIRERYRDVQCRYISSF